MGYLNSEGVAVRSAVALPSCMVPFFPQTKSEVLLGSGFFLRECTSHWLSGFTKNIRRNIPPIVFAIPYTISVAGSGNPSFQNRPIRAG